MNWKDDWLNVMVGYRLNTAEELSQTFNVPEDKPPFAFDSVEAEGNTNKKGQWIHTLATKVNNTNSACYSWYNKQPTGSLIFAFVSGGDCPCSSFQASRDRRYFLSDYGLPFGERFLWCWTSRFSRFITSEFLAYERCCYDIADGSLVTYIVANHGISTTQHSIILRNEQQSYQDALQDDQFAFSICCVSSGLCNLYEEKRPIPRCERYRPPRICK